MALLSILKWSQRVLTTDSFLGTQSPNANYTTRPAEPALCFHPKVLSLLLTSPFSQSIPIPLLISITSLPMSSYSVMFYVAPPDFFISLSGFCKYPTSHQHQNPGRSVHGWKVPVNCQESCSPCTTATASQPESGVSKKMFFFKLW